MEDLIKILLSCGYMIIVLVIFSIILSSGEVIYTSHMVLLLFSTIIGMALIVIAILLIKQTKNTKHKNN